MFSKLDIKSSILNYEVEFNWTLDKIKQLICSDNYITVIDSKVNDIYFSDLKLPNIISIESSEEIKNLSFAEKILLKFDKLNVNHKITILIIGGGVLQDSIGYCCSIFKRGINYILIPTTMLSQADSCIGGKTGLNFNGKKNLIGTFFPPQKILICFDFLESLPILEKYSGIGEIYKFFVLQNKIIEFPDEFLSQPTIGNLIYDGLKFKSKILLIDEFDKRERKFLNFGHTFGHAIESTSNYKIPHGIAVIIGVMIAIEISYKINNSISDYHEIMQIGKKLVLQTISLKKEWFDFDKLLPIIKSDKKNDGEINMILMNSNGPTIEKISSIEILSSCCSKVYESF